MAESFSESLRQEALPIWESIFAHPFLEEIEAAELPLEKFRYYVEQDYHYLAGFGQVVATALSKAPDTRTLRRLTRRITTPVERPLHGRMFELLETSEDAVETVRSHPRIWHTSTTCRQRHRWAESAKRLPRCCPVRGHTTRSAKGSPCPSTRFTATGHSRTATACLKKALLRGVSSWTNMLRLAGRQHVKRCAARLLQVPATSSCSGRWRTTWKDWPV